MAYILNMDIGGINTREDVERQKQKWREYRDYLESVRERMPTSAHEFATASWHYDTADARSLHDSWVESLAMRELAHGDRHEIRSLEIEVRLLGPYHDGNTTLIYREVHSYSLDTPFGFAAPPRDVGHGDWLRDEVRLSQRNHVLHEVEFSRGSRWIIECADIVWAWDPFSCAPARNR
jgi:hypothetical protein